ncbi:ryncolin-1-like isoform X1 [Saccostrea cucullata]|uniref:ryncolin-1-like isoform X1 n=1 Tax=Saccostrea cuccullata TaxID=36930 RepID=UPI002ED1E0AC
MGVLQVFCFILSMFMYGTFGDSSLIENEASDKNGLLPSTVSGKTSNVLRDILNQESLVRFSMVQKIQSLVMDAADSKNDRQVIKAKLSEMAKDVRNLQTKNQLLENTIREMKVLNESQSVSANIPQIEELKNQINEINVTLQKCSVNSFLEHYKYTEDALGRSVNETLQAVCRDLNVSSWILSKVLPKDCWDILQKYPSLEGRDGVYRISVAYEVKSVYCDMRTDGGGWTVIQRTQDNSTDFYRTWSKYKQGFGDLSSNYWIGNDAIYELTKNKDQELRVELQSFDDDEAYAQYSTFYVGDKYNKYVLAVSGYSGTAGDSMDYHNGYQFTTKDKDTDKSGGNCAKEYHGAWWYNNCHHTNLNGLYAMSALSGYQYPVWRKWREKEALKQTQMMIRHRN